jgi:hypothetical protein
MSKNKKQEVDPLAHLTPEQIKEKLKILEGILKQWARWGAFVQDEGLLAITIKGEEYHYYDVLNGLETLPKRQLQAVWLICIENYREAEAAKIMGFDKWSTPAQQYKNLGLKKLLIFQEQQQRGKERV